MWQTLAENPEHVPLLVTPAAASKHQKPSATATTIDIPNNVSNGNGLIEHSDQHRPLPLSPVLLSSSSPAHVMRSRLNQYKVSGSALVVNFDGDNGTTISTKKASSKSKKKKKAVDI